MPGLGSYFAQQLFARKPHQKYDAWPQSPNVDDQRQFTPSPTTPPPFRFTPSHPLFDPPPPEPIPGRGILEQLDPPWDERPQGVLPPTTVGPDPYGILNSIDKFDARKPQADEFYIQRSQPDDDFAKQLFNLKLQEFTGYT